MNVQLCSGAGIKRWTSASVLLGSVLFSGSSLAAWLPGWLCSAMVPEYCYHKAECNILFSNEVGVQFVSFPKAVKHLKPGDNVYVHGKTHVISSIQPMTTGFKLFEFNHGEMHPELDVNVNVDVDVDVDVE